MEINLTPGHRQINLEYKPISRYQVNNKKTEYGYLTDDIITGIKIVKNKTIGRLKI